MIRLTTWQALSLLGELRDGEPMEESRARRVLHDVGLTNQETPVAGAVKERAE